MLRFFVSAVLLTLFCAVFVNSVRINSCADTNTEIADIWVDECDTADGIPKSTKCSLIAGHTYTIHARVVPGSVMNRIRGEVSLRVPWPIGNLGVVKVIDRICEQIDCPTVPYREQWFNTTYTLSRRAINMRNVQVTMRLYSYDTDPEVQACATFAVDIRRR